MTIDREVLDAVSAALIRGQGDFSEGDLVAACQEVLDALNLGAAAQLVMDGRLSLRIGEDGTVLYLATDGQPVQSVNVLRRRRRGDHS